MRFHASARAGGASMNPDTSSSACRQGVTGVHSLHRFVFSVPDLAVAGDFYTAFGLDVRRTPGRVDLHTHGHPHRWGSIYPSRGAKRLEYVSFGAYAEGFDRLFAHGKSK